MADSEELQFKALHPTFVAEVQGMDWTKALTSDALIDQIKKGIARYGVLVFRNANLDNESHVAFSRRFGELDSMPLVHGRGRGRFSDQPHLFDISNLDPQGEIIKTTNRVAALISKGNELWHADMQYHPRRDKFSFLRAVQIPPSGCGGETEFADSRTAYDDLSQSVKDRLENIVCDCSLLFNRRSAAPDLYQGIDPYDWSMSRWKAVYPHEDSGRKNLYVTSYCYKFDGYSVKETETMVRDIISHGAQPKYVYKVSWNQPGDLVMWDNTAVWHRALDSSEYKFKYKRDMRRTNTYDNGSYAWGENEPGNDWKVKMPQDPLAHEKEAAGGVPVLPPKEVSASA